MNVKLQRNKKTNRHSLLIDLNDEVIELSPCRGTKCSPLSEAISVSTYGMSTLSDSPDRDCVFTVVYHFDGFDEIYNAIMSQDQLSRLTNQGLI